MKTAFVVMGTSGEYSDRREWVVAVFTNKIAADEWGRAAGRYVAKYQEERRAFFDTEGLDHYGADFDKRPKPASPFDSRLTDDYGAADASYSVASAPLNPTQPPEGKP